MSRNVEAFDARIRSTFVELNTALEFDVDSAEGRRNSLHKLDTLETALGLFREALVAEFEPYDRRARELEQLTRS